VNGVFCHDLSPIQQERHKPEMVVLCLRIGALSVSNTSQPREFLIEEDINNYHMPLRVLVEKVWLMLSNETNLYN
jgi:hypothetical protein